MTARYRCPFCGSFASKHAREVRGHLVTRHGAALRSILRPLERGWDPQDSEEI